MAIVVVNAFKVIEIYQDVAERGFCTCRMTNGYAQLSVKQEAVINPGQAIDARIQLRVIGIEL
tara:strand:+ start:1423 stop:1611 length:189 start_codon:yes stop_codon:yes gene_type:complete